jgi:AmmeMemoRadiSam system protein A
MSAPHPFVQLARAAIEAYVRNDKRIQPSRDFSNEKSSGVFVSLHEHGELRGCIGTIQPQAGSLADEIIDNAISAATRDPRFMPVAPNELGDLEISVDVLTPPILIDSIRDQDPKQHGLIVQSKLDPRKRGLLLPDLESIDTAEKQLHYTREMKAGITDPNEPTEMFRFQVKRYH